MVIEKLDTVLTIKQGDKVSSYRGYAFKDSCGRTFIITWGESRMRDIKKLLGISL